MKKFLIKVLLPFVCVFVALLGCLELYLRSLPNDFKLKANYMEKHGNEIKIWVLGSSNSAMCIKPSCFDFPSFSCAYANQSNLYSYYIFNKYFAKMDSLSYVIMDAPYDGLWSTATTAKTYNKKYEIYYKLGVFKGFENSFEISASGLDILKRILHTSDQSAFTTVDEDGFQSRYYKDLPYNDEIWKKYGKSHCESDHTLIYRDNAEDIYNSNIDVLRKTISICKSRDVKVLFVSTPCHPYYYRYYDPKQIEVLDSTYQALCNEYDNVIWWDYTESEDFSTDEMSNVNHLNPKGAVKFTRMLNDSILLLEKQQSGIK